MKQMKLILVSIFLMHYSWFKSMEPREDQELVNSEDYFPPELQMLIAGYISGNTTSTICARLIPKQCPLEIDAKKKTKRKSFVLSGEHSIFMPSNLNPCRIYFDNDKKIGAFSIQLLKNKQESHYIINDDYAQSRIFIKSLFKVINNLFDGPNDLGLLITAGTKSTGEKNLYCYYLAQTRKKGEVIYEKDCKKYYDIPQRLRSKMERQVAQFGPIAGCIRAVALCNTINRYVIADDLGIALFELPDMYRQVKDVIPNFIGYGTIDSSKIFKKISFLTPNTLLGLDIQSHLYILALYTEDNVIKTYKQTFYNKEHEEEKITNFAVDPCHPKNIILDTCFKGLLFWDLHDLVSAPKSPVSLHAKKNEIIDDLWFYNDRVCSGKNDCGFEPAFYHELKVSSYQLHSFDVSKIHKSCLIV